mmetsp:Transcript_9063/g.13631  ORF Transcript_9063/g.13631 Transcript_9063/m.13631 type:complete len:945 (+) Transcript_9063:119-2953(+)
MPFHIERCEDDSGRSRYKPVVRKEDVAYISNEKDLNDLFHLKVYHLPHKKVKTGIPVTSIKSNGKLVGEQYIRVNDKVRAIKKVKAKDVLNADSSALEAYGHVKLTTLLRKVRKLRQFNYSEQGYQRELLERIKNTHEEPKAIFVGKPIFENVPERDITDVVEWAIAYVSQNESILEAMLFTAESKIRQFAEWKERNRLRKEGVKDSSIDTLPGGCFSRLGSMEGAPDGSRSKVLRPTTAPAERLHGSLADHLNRMDVMGFDRFVEAITANNQGQSQTRHRKLSGRVPTPPKSPRRIITGRMHAIAEESPLSKGVNSKVPEAPSAPPSQDASSFSKARIDSRPVSSSGRVTPSHKHSPRSSTSNEVVAESRSSTAPSRSTTQPQIRGKQKGNAGNSSHEPRPRPPSAPQHSRSVGYQHRHKAHPISKSYSISADDAAGETIILKTSRRMSHSRTRQRRFSGSQGVANSSVTNLSEDACDSCTMQSGVVDSSAMSKSAIDNSTADASQVDQDTKSMRVKFVENIGHDVATDFGSIRLEHDEKGVKYSNGPTPGADMWKSDDLYYYNEEFNTKQLLESAVQNYQKRSEIRDKELESLASEISQVTTRAEVISEKMVNAWEAAATLYADEYHKFNAVMNTRDFERPFWIHAMYDCFSMEGNDRKGGKLGSSLSYDIHCARRKAKHKLYCRKIENLTKAAWFINILTRMKENANRTNHHIPISFMKFLAVLLHIFMYGYELTERLFYDVMERTIEHQDHKEIVVHRALKAIREHIRIDPEDFFEYLDSQSIQPCSELLVQIREIRVRRSRAARAAVIKTKLGTLSQISPRPPPGSVPRDKRTSSFKGRVSFSVPQQGRRSLSLIREDSGLNDYAEDAPVNSSPDMCPPSVSMTARHAVHKFSADDFFPRQNIPSGDNTGDDTVWETNDEDDDDDTPVLNLAVPSSRAS